MRTETELRTALLEQAADAPQLVDVLPHTPVSTAGTSRIRLWLVPAVAAAVVAVAVAVPVALSRQSKDSTVPVSTGTGVASAPMTGSAEAGPGHQFRDPFKLRLTAGPVKGCTVDVNTVTRRWEQGSYSCTAAGVSGSIYLFDAGQPSLADSSEPVAGHAKYLMVHASAPDDPGAAAQPALLWHYAPDAEAMVLGEGTSAPFGTKPSAAALSAMIEIADSVRLAPRASLVPLKFDVLGLYINQVSFSDEGGGAVLSSGAVADRADGKGNAWYIGYGTQTEPVKPGLRPFTLNGVTWRIYQHSGLELFLPGFTMTITAADLGQPYSDAELKAIAAKITLAPKPGDEKTWFNTSQLLPTR